MKAQHTVIAVTGEMLEANFDSCMSEFHAYTNMHENLWLKV